MTGLAFAWNDARVRSALGLSEADASDRSFRQVSTDTRTLGPDDLFVALRGEHFDGHDFLGAAIESGCGGLVVESIEDLPSTGGSDALVYTVADTLVALGDLARFRRNQMGIPVVGITGSSGKTTVKELALGALAGSMNAQGTAGNYNNRVGVPLTILGATDDAAVLVLELGTNQPGEIAELARVARPDIGVVTTVSETHVEQLGGLEGVLDEKLDLVRAIPEEGHIVVGCEPAELPGAARRIRPDTQVAGLTDEADPGLRPLGLHLRQDGTYGFTWAGQAIDLKVPGRHGAYNALLALAVAQFLGVPHAAAARGVSEVKAAPMRGEVVTIGPIRVVVDCYNANPQSMAGAIQTLADMETTGRRVAVLGSMLELGSHSPTLHDRALKDALKTPLDRILVTGAFVTSAEHASDPRIARFEDVDALVAALAAEVENGDLVLLKASRGVRLERVLTGLELAFGEQA
ncbi:MAG: UDP-N-acetylmuramoyl-tripeptide--D-alanyl-D-alanine ligase [Longimicrobiales bacterium]